MLKSDRTEEVAAATSSTPLERVAETPTDVASQSAVKRKCSCRPSSQGETSTGDCVSAAAEAGPLEPSEAEDQKPDKQLHRGITRNSAGGGGTRADRGSYG